MTPEELRFLALVAPILDWRLTRQDLAVRHGITSYWGFDDVVPLPPTTALSAAPLSFFVRHWATMLDCAPEYAWADFDAHQDARRNFAAILAELEPRLGVPVDSSASNTLGRVWRFGVFRAQLTVFPPDLQHPSRNDLLERHPHLAERATLSLSSDYVRVFPDPWLDRVVPLLEHAQVFGVDDGIDPYFGRRSTPLRETRRNPRALTLALAGKPLVAWHDHGFFGFSTPEVSLVYDREPGKRLVVTRWGGKGPPDPELSVLVGSERLPILTAARLPTVAAAGRLLAERLGLPVSEETLENY